MSLHLRVEECLELTDSQLVQQIAERRATIVMLVGSLYPNIIQSEINLLAEFVGKNAIERKALLAKRYD